MYTAHSYSERDNECYDNGPDRYTGIFQPHTPYGLCKCENLI